MCHSLVLSLSGPIHLHWFQLDILSKNQRQTEWTHQRKMATRTNPPSRSLSFFFFAHTIASHSTIPLYIFYCPFDVKFWPSSFHENCPSWRYVTGTKSSAYEKHEKTFSGAFRAHFSGPNSFRDFWETCVEVFPKRSLDWRCHSVLLLAGFVLIFSGKTEGKTEIPVVKCHFTVVSLSQFQNESWYKHKFWYGNCKTSCN